MPLVVATRIIYAADGTTPIGYGVTLPNQPEDIIDATKGTGNTTNQVENAVQRYAAQHYPSLQVVCHCFSISPFLITLWIGDLTAPPPPANWWQGQ